MTLLYNAAEDLIGRNVAAGRGDKIAFIDQSRTLSYAGLHDAAHRFANALRAAGVEMEQRVMLCLNDTTDFPICFLGAIFAGAVPIPVNTRFVTADYAHILSDSRAVAIVCSASLWDKMEPAAREARLKAIFASRGQIDGAIALDAALAGASADAAVAPTRPGDMAFWLYTSGTTGKPKGAVHRQSSLVQTADLYSGPILGVRESDVVYSAAKFFFAYGLGNSLTFPMAAGATSVLLEDAPLPAAVSAILERHRPTVFFGVPTLYAMLLANKDLLPKDFSFLRTCASAGEALPGPVAQRWTELTGVPILDGLGSTEMLHIFLSNRPGEVRPNSSGRCVPGYDAKLVDDQGREVEGAGTGELLVRGPSSASYYWCQREKSLETFQGEWTRSGDIYRRDADGFYYFQGRANDALKVGGIFVSPAEVEATLLKHPAVLEAAVVGKSDQDGLIKPKAFVVLTNEAAPSPELEQELINHVRSEIAEFKRPRWVEFVKDLPKTATGKIQRFKLRESAA